MTRTADAPARTARSRPATVLAAVVLVGALLLMAGQGLRRPLRTGAIESVRLEHRVDVNTADAAALQMLPGVGPGIAQRIVHHRDRHGPFTQPADLEEVPFIGPQTRARIEPWITLGK